MTSLEAETRVTSELVHKWPESIHTKRLLRMLRSTLRRYPNGKLMHRRDGFGVSLGENRFLLVARKGDLTAQDISDLLALFVVWLRADPTRVLVDPIGRSGSSVTGEPRPAQRPGPCTDEWHQTRLGDTLCACGDLAVDTQRSRVLAP